MENTFSLISGATYDKMEDEAVHYKQVPCI